MKLRAKNNTTIQYILVSNGSPITSPILPPDAFKNNVIDFLKSCPIDILQIIDSLNFLYSYLRNIWSYGYDFHVFNIEDYNLLKALINSTKQIQLFFLDGDSKEHEALYKQLKQNKTTLRFFYFYNIEENIIKEENIVTSPLHFIKSIIVKQDELLDLLNIQGIKINPSVSLEYTDFNEFFYFVPTRLNYFLLNKIIGNYGNNATSQSEEEILSKHAEESKKASQNKHSFERQELFIEQIKKIDFFINVSYKQDILKPVNKIEPVLAPLILVLPFHNPDLKDIYNDEKIIKLLQVEQTENYINEVKTKAKPGLIMAGMEILYERIRYLDDVSFLHSSFSFSPVMRLPIKGKSIYRELSFFRTKAFPNISLAKNRRKLKKTIYNFGKALKNQALGTKFDKVLKRRNGQIVAISDLPIEWMLLGGIPLSFTHDICRLPETSLHGLMSFYTHNQMIEYSVPKNILNKTLVILGIHEGGFKKWHAHTYKLSKKHGFTIRECKKNEDVKQAIQEVKPELLIFDCHGGYDKTTHSTYLDFGGEILDGHYIVKHNLYAPMVFLSACGTAPTYGTMNPIANGFFEAGAISVTSTYLPISIDSGSKLYLRILNKLDYAATHAIHKNWLEFVCHLIRTSSINDAYFLARSSKSKINLTDFFSSNVHALTESLVFSKRRELYKSMDKKLSILTNEERLYYSEVIPEYLLYSNLGRSDLILFDKWKEEYLKKNVC